MQGVRDMFSFRMALAIAASAMDRNDMTKVEVKTRHPWQPQQGKGIVAGPPAVLYQLHGNYRWGMHHMDPPPIVMLINHGHGPNFQRAWKQAKVRMAQGNWE